MNLPDVQGRRHRAIVWCLEESEAQAAKGHPPVRLTVHLVAPAGMTSCRPANVVVVGWFWLVKSICSTVELLANPVVYPYPTMVLLLLPALLLIGCLT